MMNLSVGMIPWMAAMVLGLAGAVEGFPQEEFPFEAVTVREGQPPVQFSAVLKLETSPSLASGGIPFTIELLNDSDEPMILRNPLDFSVYTLLDQKGKNLKLPGRELKFLINTRAPLQNQAFRIVSLSADRVAVTERDQDSETIRIAAKSGYRMDLLIENVRASDGTAVPISAGQYTFIASLVLMRKDSRQGMHLRAPAIQISLKNGG